MSAQIFSKGQRITLQSHMQDITSQVHYWGIAAKSATSALYQQHLPESQASSCCLFCVSAPAWLLLFLLHYNLAGLHVMVKIMSHITCILVAHKAKTRKL